MNRRKKRGGLLGGVVSAIVVIGIMGGGTAVAQKYPALGPLPAMKTPPKARVEMGRRLFFDERISGDGALSCAKC
ncbi:MAG: cytochrome c peroxidase, partial [Dehalococcoidia bacterium]